MAKRTRREIDKSKMAPSMTFMRFEEAGDFAEGTFVSKTLRESNSPQFPSSMLYFLKDALVRINGEESEVESITVSISENKKVVHDTLDKAKKGDVIGIELEEIISASVRGYNDTKMLIADVWPATK